MTDTQPTNVTKSSNRTTMWIVLGSVALVIAGLLLGVKVGLDIRKDKERALIMQSLGEQYDLGVKELEQGQYELARQRFEYILQYDQDFPGAQEKLTEVLVLLSATVTPSASPTPEISPTPDLRGVEQLFADAQRMIDESNWDSAQLALDKLRKDNPDYETIKVDGMYYILLRNRGVDKINVQHNLEGGIYDLTLAERFGPLDNFSAGLSSFAKLYLIGSSLWGVDWAQVAYYFQQVAAATPGMTDSSGYTAGGRYFIALGEYGKVLLNQDKPCDAQVQFELALSMSSTDELNSLHRDAVNRCLASLPPTPTFTETPTVTLEGPTVEPTPTDTPVQTPAGG